jgi:kynureninase
LTLFSRQDAEALDGADPLAPFRDEFAIEDDGRVYLDGNSLGRLPYATLGRIEQVVANEWGRGLIGSFDHWMTLPTRVGDLIGTKLLGAAAGQVVVGDSTTVNLYKLAWAAIDHVEKSRAGGLDGGVIISDSHNFPTDRYVLEGLAAQRNIELRLFESDPVDGPDGDSLGTALRGGGSPVLVCLSHVGYRSGALADMAELTWLAHEAGAVVLWDLCHSAGAVPVHLDRDGADLAVGCTYKYLNAGPGAPAFAYARTDLQDALKQPIWGWFGQRQQFEMGQGYHPAPGVAQLLAGTPSVIQLAAVEEGVRLLARAGIEALHAKSQRQTALAVERFDEWLAPLGFTLGTPRDPGRRGSHLSVRRADAAELTRRLIDEAGVVPDFRTPDSIRLGFAPLYTRFVDVWDGMDRLRALASA